MESTFTPSQKRAFDSYLEGAHMYVYGYPGTGKSFLIKEIVQHARDNGKRVVVTAPTGKAARNIDGVTLHRAFRLPIGILPPGPSSSLPKEIRNADLIIVDEVSMVRVDLMSRIFDTVANTSAQLIVVGDFYQLPPVLVDKEEKAFVAMYGESLFAFQAAGWQNLKPVGLVEQVRQGSDAEFANILHRLRTGDAAALDLLPVSKKANKSAVTLCPTNRQSDTINKIELAKLKNHRTYHSIVTGCVGKDDKFTEDVLDLAPGAHVLMVNNDADGRWVNGSEGIITQCNDNSVEIDICGNVHECKGVTATVYELELIERKDASGKRIKDINQKEVGSFTQIPLRLGWAITIHKSQGMTFDEVNIDPRGCFAHGQLYVALSRCSSMKGLHLLSRPVPKSLICDDRVRVYMDDPESFQGPGDTGEQQSTDMTDDTETIEVLSTRQNPCNNQDVQDCEIQRPLDVMVEKPKRKKLKFLTLLRGILHTIKHVFQKVFSKGKVSSNDTLPPSEDEVSSSDTFDVSSDDILSESSTSDTSSVGANKTPVQDNLTKERESTTKMQMAIKNAVRACELAEGARQKLSALPQLAQSVFWFVADARDKVGREDIEKQLNISTATVARAIKSLSNAGLVAHSGPRNAGTYRVAEPDILTGCALCSKASHCPEFSSTNDIDK